MNNRVSRYHDLIDRMDGYVIGTLIIDQGVATLETANGELALTDAKSIEVLNGDHYEAITLADCARLTPEGWPLLAGLYARVRF